MTAKKKAKKKTKKKAAKKSPKAGKPARKKPARKRSHGKKKPVARKSSAPARKPAPSRPFPGAKPEGGKASPAPSRPKTHRADRDLPLDLEEREELAEEERRDLVRALADDEALETAFVPTDTSERSILVVDEEGRRRNETVIIISQILPNAVIEVADDPEEAREMMQDCDFDTYVVNFLMPGYSASPFVKAVANHVDHPLLIGFAADKISDAVDQRKGLKIIPLKRLFDLDTSTAAEPVPEGANPIP